VGNPKIVNLYLPKKISGQRILFNALLIV